MQLDLDGETLVLLELEHLKSFMHPELILSSARSFLN